MLWFESLFFGWTLIKNVSLMYENYIFSNVLAGLERCIVHKLMLDYLFRYLIYKTSYLSIL